MSEAIFGDARLASELMAEDVFYIANYRYVVTDVVKTSADKVIKVWFKATETEQNIDARLTGRIFVMHLPVDIPFEFFRYDKGEGHLHIERFPDLKLNYSRGMGKQQWMDMMLRLYPNAKVVKPKTPATELLGNSYIPPVRRPWITSCGDDTREE